MNKTKTRIAWLNIKTGKENQSIPWKERLYIAWWLRKLADDLVNEDHDFHNTFTARLS